MPLSMMGTSLTSRSGPLRPVPAPFAKAHPRAPQGEGRERPSVVKEQ
ncbi:hypothetical protein HMPREF1550_02213 [Actinomyces sp. oral taxon 877 str. F0543]|nr:hypothetical protein HMPREF1550_02213 [Actinomyces sp. oral taxon 877 str. F0543]